MPDSRFPGLGTAVVPMLGRVAYMQKMMGALTKSVPDHLQVIGPKFAGKTVILHELAIQLRQPHSPYTAVLVWDLGHQTPSTEALLMKGLARELAAALKTSHPDYAEHLRSTQDNPYQEIAEVLDALVSEGAKVLAIMDGFDKPASNSNLTRNLWDQLLDLCRKPSLRMVTASRQSLYDLLRSPESKTSDFWDIFVKIRLDCFDESDLTAVLKKMPEWVLTAGAQTELWNASNGFPVFVLEVLDAVCKESKSGAVSPETVRAACDSALTALWDKLDALWNDCPATCRHLMRRVLEEGSVAKAGIPIADWEKLTERGFVQAAQNKLQRPNRLLHRYLEEQPDEASALGHLFGAVGPYQKNLRGVFERRISQIIGIDPGLKFLLEKGTEDFPDHPLIFLGTVHQFLEEALKIIWKAECWDDENDKPKVPTEWFSCWQRNLEKNRKIEDWKSRFPESGERLGLLNLITGTQNTDRLARFVTKNTYVLANAVQGFRDYFVHPKASEIDTGTAYAALHVCVELAAALTRELPPAHPALTK